MRVESDRPSTESKPGKRKVVAAGLAALATVIFALGAGAAVRTLGNELWPVAPGATPNPTPNLPPSPSSDSRR